VKHEASIIIGAGPYGLSVAAYLKARDIPTLIFGKPMEFWQNMPSGLYLKSVWSASSLSDPASIYNLNRYIAVEKLSRQEPIPLPFFLDYARWFHQHTMTDIDHTYVQSLARDGKGFHLDLADGRTVKASTVIVAPGISLFAHIPYFARDLPAEHASHTQAHSDLTCFRDRKVVIVGSGQSGLEFAALLHEVGAHVELIARGPVIWVNRTLYDRTGPARHIFYPPSDVGPPGLNWLISFPLIFSRLPDKARYTVDKRAVRPAGAQWLRRRVEGQVLLTPNTRIVKATARGQVVQLELSDGTTREVDHLLLGTGYFIGALAGHTFGPICRFVAGAKVAAQQITRHVAQTA